MRDVSASAAAGAADPVQRARQRMGYKNNWHRDNVETRQVTWSQPLADQAVAIIGGGISGLACAQGLAQHAMKAAVFDTGEHGVGGRAATRTTTDPSVRADWLSKDSSAALRAAGLTFDHAAQCFTATDPAFQQQCEAWVAAGAAKRWQGPVGTLKPGGVFTPLDSSVPVYVATGGMRQLAESMAEEAVQQSKGAVKVVRPMWVSKMTAAPKLGGWQLTGVGKDQGTYGAVVIAHNGKCANRLVGPTGAPDVARQLMRLRLSAVWVTMVAFEAPVPVPGGMEGAFVQGSPVLSWVGNNTAKLQLQHGGQYSSMQCWTLISTNSYGQSNKVPQERVPADVAAKITAEMLDAFQQVLGPAGAVQLPKPVFTRVQLWGAALPLNSPKVPCILDPAARVGVCGDWLTGASIQSAWLSGRALADRLAALRGKNIEEAAQLAVGRQDPFVPLAEATASAAEIGEFPGCKVPAAAPPPQRRQQQPRQQQGQQQRQPQQQQQRREGGGGGGPPRQQRQAVQQQRAAR